MAVKVRCIFLKDGEKVPLHEWLSGELSERGNGGF